MITALKLKELINMKQGFIFDHNKCVDCKACSAACILYNEWPVSARNIITYNPEADYLFPVLNLSLACNHCESAVCMEGCPSSAISRDKVTDAVIIDGSKCIGCRYCQWNCPYDAPKFDSKNRIITKCSLCYNALTEGGLPACSSACPTGALGYAVLNEEKKGKVYSWFPEKNLGPVIEFASVQNNMPLIIIPSAEASVSVPEAKGKNITEDVSLILFSFMSTLSVAAVLSSFIKGVFPQKVLFISFLILTALVSLIHLGRKLRSWRAVSNLRNSPLSREITAFIIYALCSSIAVFYEIPSMLIVSSVAGLIYLVLIDSVYIFSDKRKSVIMHSGQTFISALLIVSFISGTILPFIFLTLLKMSHSVYSLMRNPDLNIFSLRFVRLAFIILPAISLVSKISYPGIVITFIFLAGELFDRILFYIDFNPLNINNLIRDQLNNEKNEKKRS
jgi:Fe-S-cluster-containing dehydrogenase component/DMSO reductase anchor subunit